ncbi:MAG: HEPN family nuclease [Pirellulales bacterium]
MEYDNLIRDFAERTLKNLEAIEAAVKTDPDADVYEVTQLINSMLGLLVFPKERFFKYIPPIPLEDVRASGWPIPRMERSYRRPKDLRKLVNCLRNGISHCQIKFDTDGHRLTGLTIWNADQYGNKTWEAHLVLIELREFGRRFISLLLEFDR